MSDVPEPSKEENATKVFLRSQNTWKIGEKLPVSYVPTVEGMVATTRWIDNSLMVVFISPPYTKDEGTWAEASIMYKNAATLVRKSLTLYEFPFPTDPRIQEEVKKANGNLDILQEIVNFLNKKFPPPQLLQDQQKASSLSKGNWQTENAEDAHQAAVDRLSVQMLLSQPDDEEQKAATLTSDKLLDRLAERVSLRLAVKNTDEQKQTNTIKLKKKKKKSSSSSSSSSNSSQSSSESEATSEEVGIGEQDESGGWCKCPFSIEDVRHTAVPKQKMQGKIEERRILRKALHNIYSEYNTLKSFVKTVRTDSLSSSNRPYSSDLLWLAFHANYLNLLLLHALHGPWQTWNELAIDARAKSFLELLVRSSTNRVYPEILDEKVRKWMKKKRVGVSSHFGPIPNYLSNAKITDSGIHPKGGWESRNQNFTKSSASTTSSFKPKQQNASSDKKM